jgi:hypothetical protein
MELVTLLWPVFILVLPIFNMENLPKIECNHDHKTSIMLKSPSENYQVPVNVCSECWEKWLMITKKLLLER